MVVITGYFFLKDKNLELVTLEGKKYYLETASNQEERSKGLSGREKMAANRGMIFYYNESRRLSFWMKDTLIPLQIIFINGCEIVDIQEMAVEDNIANPEKIYYSSKPADKAIELNDKSISDSLIGQKIKELCSN